MIVRKLSRFTVQTQWRQLIHMLEVAVLAFSLYRACRLPYCGLDVLRIIVAFQATGVQPTDKIFEGLRAIFSGSETVPFASRKLPVKAALKKSDELH